jgi:hypothetical protein
MILWSISPFGLAPRLGGTPMLDCLELNWIVLFLSLLVLVGDDFGLGCYTVLFYTYSKPGHANAFTPPIATCQLTGMLSLLEN